MKICYKCKEDKDISCFAKDKARKDGYDNKCRQCRKEYNGLESRKNYRKEYDVSRKQIRNEYDSKRLKNDFNYRIKHNLKVRMKQALLLNTKSGRTIDLLGCSIDEFKLYLECQFDSNMTWENYGTYWHIDHIKPCASFDLSDVEQQKQCFHWSNMQPLEAKENRMKYDKW